MTSPYRDREPSWWGRAFRALVAAVMVLVIGVGAAAVLHSFVTRSYFIPSASMESTFDVGDRILVGLWEKPSDLKRGDIIVFADPGGWLSASESTPTPETFVSQLLELPAKLAGRSVSTASMLTKRVVGLPGDTVSCCTVQGQLMVNGVPVTEPYVLLPDGVSRVSQDNFSVTVPADSLFVLGDNRYNSADSRYHLDDATGGFVPFADVVGPVWMRLFPSSRFGLIPDASGVFASVPAPASTG